MLGPPDPDPTMDLTALDIVKTVVMDSPNKLFVGGLPCDWSEDQVRISEGVSQPDLETMCDPFGDFTRLKTASVGCLVRCRAEGSALNLSTFRGPLCC